MRKFLHIAFIIVLNLALAIKIYPQNTSSPPDYKHRQIAVMALLSNVNYGMVAPKNESLLQAHTAEIKNALSNNNAIRQFVGNDWQVVWGPVTSNSMKKKVRKTDVDSFVTDNTMYVAYGTLKGDSEKSYVVGISGTNIVSRKGWWMEDFNVSKKVKWPNGEGKISKGSSIGLDILLQMKDSATQLTLIDFFEKNAIQKETRIAVSGHSLGGCLSPLIALKIKEWKNNNPATGYSISTYPMAGPTSGDAAFARYLSEQLRGSYHSIINDYDIVPKSWQKEDLAKIPNLYNDTLFNNGKGIKMSSLQSLLFDAVKLAVKNKGYTRIDVENEYVFKGIPYQYAPGETVTYLKEARYQHILAYYQTGLALPENVIEAIVKICRSGMESEEK